MADDISRAADAPAEAVRNVKTSEFANVEFLDSAMADPLQLLRSKLKEFDELPDSVAIRRVIVITELVTEDGRGMDVAWNEDLAESGFVVQDSVVSMLARVQAALASE